MFISKCLKPKPKLKISPNEFFVWHYHNSWFFEKSKLTNKSFFTNGHVHFDYKPKAWMTCVFFFGKLDLNDLFDYMSNWTSSQIGQSKMTSLVNMDNGFLVK